MRGEECQTPRFVNLTRFAGFVKLFVTLFLFFFRGWIVIERPHRRVFWGVSEMGRSLFLLLRAVLGFALMRLGRIVVREVRGY